MKLALVIEAAVDLHLATTVGVSIAADVDQGFLEGQFHPVDQPGLEVAAGSFSP